jgi:protein-tyrosine sulfotransferase
VSTASGIVLLGSPRSGTTLLRRLLGHHSNIISSGETGLFRGAAEFLKRDVSGVGVEMGVLAGLGHLGYSEEEVKSRVADTVISFLDEYAQKNDKALWLEKDAFNAFHINEIQEIFGSRLRYICIVRHGLDVAVSMDEFSQKSRSYILGLHQYVQQNPNPLEAFAQAWADISVSMRALLDEQAGNALLVKYEDLVASPEGELERILEFLGEPFEQGMVEGALKDSDSIGLSDWKAYSRASIGAESIGRWTSLAPYTIARLAKLANPMLESYGYDQVGDEWSESPEKARRRYELGLALNLAKSQGEKPAS